MLFHDDHDAFRASVRAVLEREVEPYVDAWEDAGIFPAHELFPKLAAVGLLGLEYDAAYGGEGADHWYTVIACEEFGRTVSVNGISMAYNVQANMATPSLHAHGSHELKERFLAPAVRGEQVCSIAVTEPDAGSDVAGLRTRAERDGDSWVITGSKLYITNAPQGDWMCVLVRTSDEGGYRGMSQIIVPNDTPGVSITRKLDKLGNRSSDTAEVVFDRARVPVENTIGEVGRGFQQQMQQFQTERICAVYQAVGQMETAIGRTLRFLRERSAFGGPLLDNQYLVYRLTELASEVEAVRAHAHACAELIVAGRDATRQTSVAKLLSGRLIREVADTCLQYHGGMGYMSETWTSRFLRDSRLLSIGGGADEVMLRVLSRELADGAFFDQRREN
ncbi:acyl-CoA dehydrogenase [Nocardioides marmoriginsengisoli]|uniref:Acyl-CoA dehydrogenase n=1 Tax=Nocardioides marmoriginsengisoli TaxID=661483 RepID=A0A3N0CFX0_9ACTN|nr:acyl-CoA dehydrogenase family protein [Nocardioides marmoriginsengisoli]RNL62354.1 acyl-CoA dehydrogenase [Nocardioides marmoriginsengisoli]